ncbi:leucine-rich melanocyte differentiation-associated protein-like [Liolophura sinensis]|uniref:leucine-rich melanocyte differentiation-associated protein-like n=1 Tax=Liolophura sinensis TaxID=3198878 RepID=UPI0031595162
MADITDEKLDEDVKKVTENDSYGLSENDRQTEDRVETSTESIDPIFTDGHLSYVGHDATSIPESLIQQFASKTTRLDLSFNCLCSVDGLESFTQLRELILDSNEIQDGVLFPYMKQLNTLTLNKNKITDLDSLIRMIKVQMPSLSYLSLLGNRACPNQLSDTEKDEEDYQRYRYYVLYHLPKLKFLDSSQVKIVEVKEAERVGPFMKVVRPDGDEKITDTDKQFPTNPYSPLPNSRRQDGQHVGTYGVCKYVYYGRHSEGNRFIRNSDL